MEEIDRQKQFLKVIHCFKGPVHQAFVYVYYQTYTQNVDMYTFARNTNKCAHFSEKEMQILEKERRPIKLNLFLLHKILKSCCTPALSGHDDPIWLFSDTGYCSSGNKIEQILSSLQASYQELLFHSKKLSISDMDKIIDILVHNVCLLVENAAKCSNSKRWTEERERLKICFSDIKKGDYNLHSENISDFIRIEAEFKIDLIEKLLSKELSNIDASSWHLQALHQNENDGNPKEIEFEEYENFDAKNILKFMQEEQERIRWIIGEHGVGKSSFAASIASVWAQKSHEIQEICEMNFVFVISSSLFERDVDIFRVMFPLSSLVADKSLLEEFLHREKVLFIIDDITKDCDVLVRNIYKITEKFSNVNIWLMGRYSIISKYAKESSFISPAIVLELKGLKKDKVLSLSDKFLKNMPDSLKINLKRNMNRLGYVLKYPTITFMTFELLQENQNVLKNIYTASDLMWEILCWHVKHLLKANLRKIGPARKKFLGWLMLAGELSLYSLKLDLCLDKASLEELELEICSLYKDGGKMFLDSLFKPSLVHSPSSCFSVNSSTNKPLLEYLSSWYFIEQLLQNKQLPQLIKGLVNPLPLILFTAGHLERYQDEGNITIPEERKVIRALITYKENSFEDFSFIQKFVAELKCIKRLLEIVIDETEYNEEWNLFVPELQLKPLEALLNHVSPTRLILLVDESKKNYELNDVINFICRVDISVWLDSVPHFTYGNSEILDHHLDPFLGEFVVPKIDLISGSLSSNMLRELTASPSTQHLVLLKLKVSSKENLNATLSASKYLKHLLWLEIKLDINFDEIEISEVEKNEIPLFDFHLRHIKETDVTFVADLLAAISLCYTGIHLEETMLTPEGVFTLLKELNKKGVSFHGDKDSMNKFRLWYYPSLSSFPKYKIPTEEECIEIIGHDDRDMFSDHYVVSSQFVRTIDAWNLRNYLETQENIFHFVYEASNIIFTKCLDGQVKINFKGDYKETIEDKILGSGRVVDDSTKDIENHVFELY